ATKKALEAQRAGFKVGVGHVPNEGDLVSMGPMGIQALVVEVEDQRTAWVELTLTSGATKNSEIGTVVYRPSEESTQVTCDGFLLAGAATHPTYEAFEGTDPGDRCYHGTLQLKYDPQAGTLSYDQRDIQSTATGTLTPSN
ncbi:MAG: hypothetical protein GY773_29935, partial [Actinomycetia bacterium]|nr:hypothetical protein [Actinomycetes bacterium]